MVPLSLDTELITKTNLPFDLSDRAPCARDAVNH